MTDAERHELVASDGSVVHLQLWLPRGPGTHIIQIVHGLGEYSDRYADFANAATTRGCIVACHDHRGHGSHAQTPGYFGDRNGWNTVVDDVRIVNRELSGRYPALPQVLLGHSMGSYVAQAYAMQYGSGLAALILSASSSAPRTQLRLAYLLAKFEGLRVGKRNNSAVLDQLGFGKFNSAFEPARTEMDWLSRDPISVDRYINDPLCGGPYTCGLWQDLLGGLLVITDRKALSTLPDNLPILITGGASDPVGGKHGMSKLALRYLASGQRRVQIKIYALGRHEMLHEINRKEVASDWLDWIMRML